MTAELAQLMAQAQGFLAAAFVVFLRVGAAMALMPAFGEQLLPMRVRLALAVAFTLIVLPALGPALPVAGFSPALFAEVLIGLLLGMMLRLFVLALQVAGTMIAQSISLSQLFGGTDGEPQPAVGNLLILSGLALAVHLGLPVKLAQLLVLSYDALPPGRFPDGALVQAWGLSGVAQAFTLAFSIAMPFVLGALVYNVALGAINRAMPQLMVAFVGAPALTLGGLILLMVALPSGLMLWYGAFDAFIADPFEVRR